MLPIRHVDRPRANAPATPRRAPLPVVLPAALLAALLAGCGNKGDLYLTEPDAAGGPDEALPGLELPTGGDDAGAGGTGGESRDGVGGTDGAADDAGTAAARRARAGADAPR